MIAAYLPLRQNRIGAHTKAYALLVLTLGVSQAGLYWIFHPHIPQLPGNGLDRESRGQSCTLGPLDVPRF